MPQKERSKRRLESRQVRVQEVIPVSKSRPYSCLSVKSIEIQQLVKTRVGQSPLAGVDVAKDSFVLVLHWPDGSFQRPWRIKSPSEISEAVAKLAELNQHCPVKVAMESSGTYGDALRQALADAQLPVVRVSGKAVKDQSESFDGVPSQHDGKDAAIIADLGRRGKSRDWQLGQASPLDQELRYWVRKLDRAQRIKQMHGGRIEALLARHWPEANAHLASGSATLAGALARWGDPARLAADPQAPVWLARVGGRYLTAQKIADLLESARTTVGVRMNRWERRELRELAKALLARRKTIARCRRRLKALTTDHPIIGAQAPAVGLISACVLWMCLGDPRNYSCAAAYRKAMGLNLVENSSGQQQSPLRLSKRGQRLSRKWMYFAALRQMKHPAVRTWVGHKKQRDGGKGSRAVTAVMRRLALAAWHVAVHGVEFNAVQLFPSGRFDKRPRPSLPRNIRTAAPAVEIAPATSSPIVRCAQERQGASP
jgi:transposase